MKPQQKIKTGIIFLFLAAAAFCAQAQTSLEVTIKNIKDSKGNIRVGLFKDDKTFLKEAWKGQVVKAATGEVKVIFENIPTGSYAISIVHDENENGEMDSNLIGIPKEGFGFSNDAMGTFGPPDFEKAKFELGSVKKNLSVSLRYM